MREWGVVEREKKKGEKEMKDQMKVDREKSEK